MDAEPSMATIGALIGSPARAAMLSVLFDGRSLTATELAQISGVSAATASEHLAKLTEAKLLVCEVHGRHRYYKISRPEVAEALKAIVHLAPTQPVPARTASPKLEAMRNARLCYDHFAGTLGVMIADALILRQFLTPNDRDFVLTDTGESFLGKMGVDVQAARTKRRVFARKCLDWSERRPHLAGSLGAEIAETAFRKGWINRTAERRIVEITPCGRKMFQDELLISV